MVRYRRCRSSWDGPGIGNILLSIRGLAENFDTFHPLATWSQWSRDCVSMLLFEHPSLSNDLFAIELRLASWEIYSCKVIRNYHGLESGSDPLYCFFIRSKTNATIAEGQSLRYVLQARMALDGSGYLSQLVQFNIAQFLNRATRFFAALHGVVWLSQICNNRFSAGAIS